MRAIFSLSKSFKRVPRAREKAFYRNKYFNQVVIRKKGKPFGPKGIKVKEFSLPRAGPVHFLFLPTAGRRRRLSPSPCVNGKDDGVIRFFMFRSDGFPT